MFRSTLVALAVIITVVIFAPPPAAAATCSTLTTSSLFNFPNYNVFNSAVTTQTGSVVLTCSHAQNASFILTLSAGNGTAANRKMLNGTNALFYNMYVTGSSPQPLTSATNTIISDTTAQGVTFSGPGNNGGLTETISFEGQIAAHQNVPIGPYSDTLTFSINF